MPTPSLFTEDEIASGASNQRSVASSVNMDPTDRIRVARVLPRRWCGGGAADTRAWFLEALPAVTQHAARHPAVRHIPHLDDWITQLVSYNLSGGKAARGLTVVAAFDALAPPAAVDDESRARARSLGWCVEMFQSYLLLLDDIMDGGTVRRGRDCWHRRAGVGAARALNDGLILHGSMARLLRDTCAAHPNYLHMLHAFHESLLVSSFGQFLDLKLSSERRVEAWSPALHRTLVAHKSAHYTYELPVLLGALLAGPAPAANTRRLLHHLSVELGTLFQIQDDYMDCYSAQELNGKEGSDIAAGRCTWLAAAALARCSAAQRVVFRACYGSAQPAHVERVRRLYDQLRLPALYAQLLRDSYRRIAEQIDSLPTDQWKALFTNLLDDTYNRKK